MSSKFQRYGVEIPELVQQAIALAKEAGFPVLPEGNPLGYNGPPSACIPEVGKLLSVLAAGCTNGKVAEFGTGAGVGTAWLLTGLPANARLFSAEIDASLVERTRNFFAAYPNVEIRLGDCFDVMKDEAPFDLLFMDCGVRQALIPEHWDSLTEMVRVGGKIVFDDLTPLELWPSDSDSPVDPKREFAFRNQRVIGAEVRTTATQAALIITRIR